MIYDSIMIHDLDNLRSVFKLYPNHYVGYQIHVDEKEGRKLSGCDANEYFNITPIFEI